MSRNNKSGKGFFIGFLAGSAVGAVVALLTTPKSGENLKKELKQKSDKYFDEVDKYFSETKHNAGKVIDESRRKLASILHDLKSKPEAIYRDAEKVFNDVKGKTKEVFDSGKERVEKETERLTSSVKAGIGTYNDEKKQ
ncbi:MAG: YtxH domain-containing protein [Melioribacteraceae bacterium]|nr:YtxH domain-containing protein [Melioribacteraceae bacterium]MCF8396296.1 YtxH domain-containing protein [Melioribacteraceae bacterium]MCF8421181.1 YtxH domain-containing protein [Melioribacteraceae bacterium]